MNWIWGVTRSQLIGANKKPSKNGLKTRSWWWCWICLQWRCLRRSNFPTLLLRIKGTKPMTLHLGLGSPAVRFTPLDCVLLIFDFFVVRLVEATTMALAGRPCAGSFFIFYKKPPSSLTFLSSPPTPLAPWPFHPFSTNSPPPLGLFKLIQVPRVKGFGIRNPKRPPLRTSWGKYLTFTLFLWCLCLFSCYYVEFWFFWHFIHVDLCLKSI